jgi:hypothetical protein
MDGAMKRASSKKMAGRWHVPDVVGVHHERMERDARKYEDSAGSYNNEETPRGHGREEMEYVDGEVRPSTQERR